MAYVCWRLELNPHYHAIAFLNQLLQPKKLIKMGANRLHYSQMQGEAYSEKEAH